MSKKGGNYPSFLCVIRGVRQGENLSPLLFALYLNDFERTLKKDYHGLTTLGMAIKRELSDDDIEFFVRMYLLLYSDDTIILAESEEELQKALDSAGLYCDRWHLTVNLSKTKIVIFSKGKIKNHREFTFKGRPVEVVSQYVYLGTTFTYNGSFGNAMQKQVDQARKAMFAMRTKARRLLLPVDVQIDLFDKCVLPILLYGCEIWGYSNIDQLEVFYRKFLKSILKLNWSTPSCQVYGEVGKLPLLHIINKHIISFWIKISEGKTLKYTTILYSLVYKLHISGNYYFKWVENVKDILDSCNFHGLWRGQLQYHKQGISKQIQKSNICYNLHCVAVEKWKSELATNQYSFIYRMFKENLKFESYLTIPKPSIYQRASLSKFRTGNNKLPISKFKFSRIAQDKMCPFCINSDGFFVGNEIHFLFECTTFAHEHSVFLHRYFYIRPNSNKIKELFNSENLKTLIYLSKLVDCIMKRFQ